jgi:Abortive infection alpha
MDAPEIIKTGGSVIAALKLTDIGRAILGPATAEFADRLRDQVRMYRFSRQLEAMQKAEKMVADAGLTPNAVPLKLLFPLLEGASLEEDEDLHSMWAALLANASTSKFGEYFGFVGVLQQLTKDDAQLLQHIYRKWADECKFFGEIVDLGTVHYGTEEELLREARELLSNGPENLSHTIRRVCLCIDNLIRLRLITTEPDMQRPEIDVHSREVYWTTFGCEFVCACQPLQRTQAKTSSA